MFIGIFSYKNRYDAETNISPLLHDFCVGIFLIYIPLFDLIAFCYDIYICI